MNGFLDVSGSSEGIEPRDRASDDQRLNGVGALVGVNGFDVGVVPGHRRVFDAFIEAPRYSPISALFDVDEYPERIVLLDISSSSP
jgi:hypothetical protein